MGIEQTKVHDSILQRNRTSSAQTGRKGDGKVTIKQRVSAYEQTVFWVQRKRNILCIFGAWKWTLQCVNWVKQPTNKAGVCGIRKERDKQERAMWVRGDWQDFQEKTEHQHVSELEWVQAADEFHEKDEPLSLSSQMSHYFSNIFYLFALSS